MLDIVGIIAKWLPIWNNYIIYIFALILVAVVIGLIWKVVRFNV